MFRICDDGNRGSVYVEIGIEVCTPKVSYSSYIKSEKLGCPGTTRKKFASKV